MDDCFVKHADDRGTLRDSVRNEVAEAAQVLGEQFVFHEVLPKALADRMLSIVEGRPKHK